MAISAAGAYGSTYQNGLADTATSSTHATSTVASATVAAKRGATGNSSPAVIISLSKSALAALRAQSDTDAGSYAAYFPVRDGASAEALAAAVGNPGGTGSSDGKNFAQVATDARTRMDAKYAAMTASGAPFDYDSAEGRDWYTLMGDLDRRSLYAVSSNEGGQFSQQEQTIAKTVMNQQLGLSMGLYTGPTSQADSFNDPFGSDTGARFAAAKAFLEDVSQEERQSDEWQRQSALIATVATSDNGTTAPASMTLFDYLAAADQAQDTGTPLFGRGASYAQIAKLSY